MARKTKPLTDTEIKAAKPKDADYQQYDGYTSHKNSPSMITRVIR